MRTSFQAIQDLPERTAPQTNSRKISADRTQKALKERGIDKMLEEAREDNRENDAEYMKPGAR